MPGLTLSAQNQTLKDINHYGTLDRWCAREIKESGVIGGEVKTLYEFYGNGETKETKEPFVAPEGYLWRTNNVMAKVAGVTKVNTTVFPEKRGDGYCARIETHIEAVQALGIINMKVTCQGAFILGSINEPIRDTKNPMEKLNFGVPFQGRPAAVVFDYKADVGHEVIRGTGFSGLKNMGIPDYPQVTVLLQKRWEDEKGKIHALRVGTAMVRFTENVTEWMNGYRMEIQYGDITSSPYYKDYMALLNDKDYCHYYKNSQGDNVPVIEEGWASADDEPNHLIISFLSSSGGAFFGGVGNTLWIDNIRVEM